MSVIYIALPVALLIAMIAVIAFIWATRSGQFDDLDTPRYRMLHDETDVRETDDAPDSDEPRP